MADQAGAFAGRLQLDDASSELGLERAGVGAAGRCAPGHGVDAAGGLAPRPLEGRLVDAARNAAARGEQRVHRHRVAAAGRRVERGDRPDALCVERLEHE